MQDPHRPYLSAARREAADPDHRPRVVVNAHETPAGPARGPAPPPRAVGTPPEPPAGRRSGRHVHGLAVGEREPGAPVEVHARPGGQRRLRGPDAPPERGARPGPLPPPRSRL